jgi:toxin-antitoxin system PIN domain toxin
VSSNRDLLDINVWLALVDEGHSLHQRASLYWEERADRSLSFCRITMLGFLRLSTQTGVLSEQLTPQEAWSAYQQLLGLPFIDIIPEPDGLEFTFSSLTLAPGLPHRLWTDAYLAAFAITGAHRLVSFDGDFSCFPMLDFLHLTS